MEEPGPTPAAKNFTGKRPKEIEYVPKRQGKASETASSSSEKTDKVVVEAVIEPKPRKFDRKLAKALNQVVQEPKVIISGRCDNVPIGTINIVPTGEGK